MTGIGYFHTQHPNKIASGRFLRRYLWKLKSYNRNENALVNTNAKLFNALKGKIIQNK